MPAPTVRPAFLTRHGRVPLYVPNLIGYLRVACAAYAFSVALTNPVACIVFYFIGFVCDELDGRFARMLNQSSVYGAVLDMVTDRLSTAGLLVLLCVQYPASSTAFLSLLALDIASHWAQAHAAAASGAATHKDTANASLLVRLYYRHRLFMGACCVSCEVLYLALYALAPRWASRSGTGIAASALAARGPSVRVPAAVASLARKLGVPGGATGGGGAWWTGAPAGAPTLPAAALVAAAMLPGVAIKQFVNWKQLVNAFGTLAALDGGSAGGAVNGGGEVAAAAPAAPRRSRSRKR